MPLARRLGRTLLVIGLAGAAAGTPAGAASRAATVDVKFAEGTGVTLRDGRLVDAAGDPLPALERVLARHDVRGVDRTFRGAPADLRRETATLERRSRRALPDRTLFFRLEVPAAQAASLASDLEDVARVEAAQATPEPAPPPVSPSFVSQQGYRLAAPNGVDAVYAGSLAGGTGANAKVVDIEYSFNRAHEDLTKLVPAATVIHGTPYNAFGDDHGTAAMGILIGGSNAFGITGLAPGAAVGISYAFNDSGGYAVHEAVDAARAALSPGDVVLLEQQTNGTSGYVPIEYQLAVHAAISTATAAGIIVVEAAGNGSQNLDGADYGPNFPRGQPDSGAIIVGAGDTPGCGTPRSRSSFSTYGSRVDVQGWGGCVTTSGYGSLYSDAGPNAYYTSGFNGTSSASAVVAGLTTALSSAYEAAKGTPPTPAYIRALLKSTGTPQDKTFDSGDIGPLPNLKAALDQIGGTTPSVSSFSPADQAVSVSRTSNVRVTFSEPMNQAATNAAFTLTRSGDATPVAGAKTWSGNVLTFNPTADLAPGAVYTARVATSATDLGGTPLAAPVSSAFTTSANLVANPSFESTLAGWGGVRSALTRVALAGAPQGANVARVDRLEGSNFSISDGDGGAQPTVPSTDAGATYIATGYARAASAQSAGRQVKLTLRETTLAGAHVRETSFASTQGDTAFKRLAVALDVPTAGDRVGVRMEQFGSTGGDGFFADNFTLVKAERVLGETTPGTTWTALTPNAERVTRAPFVITRPADIAKLRVHVDGKAAATGTQPLRGVLYRDSSGSPTSLVTATAEVQIAAGKGATWVSFKFPTLPRITPGTYWIGLHAGGPTAVARVSGRTVAGATRTANDNYADGTAPAFGTSTVRDQALAGHAIGG